MVKGSRRAPSNGKKQITLRMDQAHFEALETLIPGFGSTVAEIARYIIIDWMKANLGIAQMRKLKLVE